MNRKLLFSLFAFVVVVIVLVFLSSCATPTPQVFYIEPVEAGAEVNDNGIEEQAPDLIFAQGKWYYGRLFKYEDEDVICIFVYSDDDTKMDCFWKNLPCLHVSQ